MSPNFTFIYDGECPFCKQFAELIELKSNLPNIEIKNARENPPEIPYGYDMDRNGAILIRNDELLYGAEAVQCICSYLNDPSGPLLKILSNLFANKSRTKIIFPFLIIARRFALLIKGASWKI